MTTMPLANEVGKYKNFSGTINWRGTSGIVVKACFTLFDNMENLHWHSGTWQMGVFYDAMWKFGTWKNGTFRGSLWRGGYWHGGLFLNSVWYEGHWYDGHWEGGKWYSGLWRQGNWVDGYIEGILGKQTMAPNNFARR